MTVFIKAYDIELWKVIVLGPHIIENRDGSLKNAQEYTNADWKKERTNAQAMQLLLCGLTLEEIRRISICKSAQEIWKTLEVTYEGTSQVKETKINLLQHEFELFSINEGESITNAIDKFSKITNGLEALGKKIIRSLPKEWDSQVTAIMETKDLNTLDYNALIGSLINYEIILRSRERLINEEKALKAQTHIQSEKESGEKSSSGDEEDEELQYYSKALSKYKNLMRNKIRERERKARKKKRRENSSSSSSDEDDRPTYLCLTAH